jgi:hypothetical protein
MVRPLDGATNVPATTTVTATYDEPLTSTSIVLTDPAGKAVAGRTTCNSPCTTATFTPAARLKPHTVYGVRSTGTNRIGTGSSSWSFKTK